MQRQQQPPQQNEPPPHVLARREALQNTWRVLGECDGDAPDVNPGLYSTNYFDAVKTECHREIFGMLDTFHANNPDDWLSINGVTLQTHEHDFDEEKARLLDNSLVVVVGCGDRDPFVGMLSTPLKSAAGRRKPCARPSFRTCCDATLGSPLGCVKGEHTLSRANKGGRSMLRVWREGRGGLALAAADVAPFARADDDATATGAGAGGIHTAVAALARPGGRLAARRRPRPRRRDGRRGGFQAQAQAL